MAKKYSKERIDFIAENIQGRPFKDLTNMFNARFGTHLKASAMKSLAMKYGFRNGRGPVKFKKGQTPWNKGKKGVNFGGKETQFKPGQKPWNYKPVGTEGVNKNGYVEIKVSDSQKWKRKHRVIWEEANGPVPKGHTVIFADGNRQNITLDNLLLVSLKELVIMNQRGLISADAELTKTGVTIADIHLRIGERKRKEIDQKN